MLPSPLRSPKAAPKLTPFWSSPQALETFSKRRPPRLRNARCVSANTGLFRTICPRASGLPAMARRAIRSWLWISRYIPFVTNRSARPSLSRSSQSGAQVQPVASSPARCAASRHRPVPVFRKRALLGNWRTSFEPSSGTRIRARDSAIARWSSTWPGSAMSATSRPSRPSLFTSPRSEPIDE